MNGQRFHLQKRIEMETEQCERSLSLNILHSGIEGDSNRRGRCNKRGMTGKISELNV